MLLLATGSRYITAAGKRYARRVVQRVRELGGSVIVGDAQGIDEVVMHECDKLGVRCTVVGAYNRLRRRTRSCKAVTVPGSYTQRDRYMAEQCDLCLAIWNGESRGTKKTHDYAVELGKTAWLKIFPQRGLAGVRGPANKGVSKVKTVQLYTDGACSGNPGPGGWAAILRWNSHERVLSGGELDTTNNRMELTAVIEGLAALRKPCRVTVYTDSQYVVGVMAMGWKRKANRDLLFDLDALCAAHEVTFRHVRGHNGHPINERCDRIACQERDKAKASVPNSTGAQHTVHDGPASNGLFGYDCYEVLDIRPRTHRLPSGYEQLPDMIADMA